MEEITHASEVRDVVFQSHFSGEQAERDTSLERKAKIVVFIEHAQVVASIQFQAQNQGRIAWPQQQQLLSIIKNSYLDTLLFASVNQALLLFARWTYALACPPIVCHFERRFVA